MPSDSVKLLSLSCFSRTLWAFGRAHFILLLKISRRHLMCLPLYYIFARFPDWLEPKNRLFSREPCPLPVLERLSRFRNVRRRTKPISRVSLPKTKNKSLRTPTGFALSATRNSITAHLESPLLITTKVKYLHNRNRLHTLN